MRVHRRQLLSAILLDRSSVEGAATATTVSGLGAGFFTAGAVVEIS